MPPLSFFFTATGLAPLGLMTFAALLARSPNRSVANHWRQFIALATAGSIAAVTTLAVGLIIRALPASLTPSISHGIASDPFQGWIGTNALGLWVAVLVQGLGTVIGAFSARYLQGEPAQRRYVSALAVVLACVHLLLLAQHWLVLIAAWAAIGVALERLLCFYPDRPFALLASHKKRLADRLADGLLLVAAALAWWEVGSGSLPALWQHLAHTGASPALQCSAMALVLAVILRTALLPVHGWLIQVMEAPTPVSALLHAGVVNLGGYVLISFAPLLEAAPAARWILVVFGLSSAVLAGLVMLTRVSIKVRLAWSTVAQMGFMVVECGVGLYSFAALHLIGHSLYKAQAFLSASSAVHSAKQQMLRGHTAPSSMSLLLAPLGTLALVGLLELASIHVAAGRGWPWWWTGVMAFAWAPVLWSPLAHAGASSRPWQAMLNTLAGAGIVAGLTALALMSHRLPLGATDVPNGTGGTFALAGLAAMYLCLVALQVRPEGMALARRWSYAGFYLDELYTRLALQLWPPRWTPQRGSPGSNRTEHVFKSGTP